MDTIRARWTTRLEILLSVVLAVMLVVGAAGLVGTVVSVFVRPSVGVALVVPDTNDLAGALRPGARFVRTGATAAVAPVHGSLAFAGLYLLTWLSAMLIKGFALNWPGVSPLIGVLTGLGLLAVAEIIRRGLALLADLEGTV